MPSYAETYTVGDLVRKEVEISRGATLVITIDVPGGTAGKTFTSTFKHHTYESSTAPVPQPGVDLGGSFLISVVDSTSVQLTTNTGTLLLGKHYYDVASTTTGGFVNVSSLREFNILGAVGTVGGPGVLPPGSDAAALIDIHNSEPSAHGGQLGGGTPAYSSTFTQADLTLYGLLVRTHTLPQRPASVLVYDEAGYLVTPSATTATVTTIVLDLSDFVPIGGSWLLVASV